VPVNVEPCVLASGHETVFEGSETQGALGRRCPNTQGGGRQDLLGVDAHHKERWLKRRPETADVEPEPIPGRPSRKGAMLQEWLPEHLQANDDLTLEEHRQAFEEHFGQRVSTSTIGRAIAALPDGGWPLKKSPR
jgi:transposase